MEPIFWSILLLVLALAVIVLEVFVPSGGFLAIVAASLTIASIAVAFTAGPREGLTMLAVAVVLVPTVIAGMIKWWPHTPIGKLVLIVPPEDPDDLLPESEEYRGLTPLIGKLGRAKSKMLPSGSVTIDGRTYDAFSDGPPIEAGQAIKVIAVRTHRIVVRPTGEQPPVAARDSPPRVGDDVLSQPAEAFGLDGLNDPLA